MHLGRASAFGMAAMVYLGEQEPDRAIAADEIAKATGVPIDYLRKILQRLVRSGILAGERGRNGGFRLRKFTREISLLEIFEAISGPIDHTTILNTPFPAQPLERIEQTLDHCRDFLAAQLSQLLMQTTLADLLNGNLNSLSFFPPGIDQCHRNQQFITPTDLLPKMPLATSRYSKTPRRIPPPKE